MMRIYVLLILPSQKIGTEYARELRICLSILSYPTFLIPRVFPVNWFYRLTGSHLRVVVLCEMVVLTTRTVRVISCLILLLIHKIK